MTTNREIQRKQKRMTLLNVLLASKIILGTLLDLMGELRSKFFYIFFKQRCDLQNKTWLFWYEILKIEWTKGQLTDRLI